jgi:hypothetical protein
VDDIGADEVEQGGGDMDQDRSKRWRRQDRAAVQAKKGMG